MRLIDAMCVVSALLVVIIKAAAAWVQKTSHDIQDPNTSIQAPAAPQSEREPTYTRMDAGGGDHVEDDLFTTKGRSRGYGGGYAGCGREYHGGYGGCGRFKKHGRRCGRGHKFGIQERY
ncbi:hypothetical protein SeMB42_g07868 [Synchytrium endobioticum]|uniref:Uncharacterized protein n=1 Tax=Synchytrium endobioticum TaxID=286115 RepID=A0A507BN52_9FUNG|nr:hypothetical protein SeMB42_g07868 [Synchytrium endobioticum]TPX31570.1 hypothetical protein SeLEV6574_g08525 [Synchytrium endobioticum]